MSEHQVTMTNLVTNQQTTHHSIDAAKAIAANKRRGNVKHWRWLIEYKGREVRSSLSDKTQSGSTVPRMKWKQQP